jgi:hypothetical protein
VHIEEVVVLGDGEVLSGLESLYVPPVMSEKRANSRPIRGQKRFVKGEFLRGPIPMLWLRRVCRLPGKNTLATALAIWWLAGLRRREEGLSLTTAALKRFEVVTRSAKYDALKALEAAKLISVRRKAGKNPAVTILPVEPEGDDQTAA